MSCPAPVFPPSQTKSQCTLRALRLILPIIVALLFSWVPAIRCWLNQMLFELRWCRQGNTDQTIDVLFDPNEWLAGQQHVAAALVWELPGGALHPWSAWNAGERKALYDAFWQARMNIASAIDDAPPDAAPAAVGQSFGTFFTPAEAWQRFIAHAGQSIATEQARWVSWSIVALPPPQLAVLFDSRSFFAWNAATARYSIDFGTAGAATPGDPVPVFRFLRTMIAPTVRVTVDDLVSWCRANLVHFLGGYDAANFNDHWQYTGLPPVQRVIQGTTRGSDGEFGHFTAGCHGTTGLLRAVLRTANVAVEYVGRCGHALPHFMRDDLYLSHGDDPYDRLALFVPPRPIDELLIDGTQFETWFGASVSPDAVCHNVGRQPRELALLHPTSDYLLHQRCADIAAGTPDATSGVYAIFAADRTVAELEAAGFWASLDAAIAARGGCAAIPPG